MEHQYTLSELPDVASEILKTYPTSKIFLFTGEMGTGKTTLIEEVCRSLGTTDILSSPTYSIINQYNSSCTIYHMDLFRLRSTEELLDIGFEDIVFSGDYCFIEWPDFALPILSSLEYTHFYITSISDVSRIIKS
jgi:tRNA threonylcarbamoyladenosine biosynthesis protein TsaE